jgi:hypothetical protein
MAPTIGAVLIYFPLERCSVQDFVRMPLGLLPPRLFCFDQGFEILNPLLTVGVAR